LCNSTGIRIKGSPTLGGWRRAGPISSRAEEDSPGIPSEVREKIFTPFFTTKSRGSGLGLPTAKRLIEEHRGNIAIACPTSGGMIVTVELPATGAIAIM
jgi:two-component system nitrogen regulation sensor histidine kinase GlnL